MHKVLRNIEANFLELPKIKLIDYGINLTAGTNFTLSFNKEFIPPPTMGDFFVDFMDYYDVYGSIRSGVNFQDCINVSKSLLIKNFEFTPKCKYRSLMDIFRLSNYYYNCSFEDFLLTIIEKNPISYTCNDIKKCIVGPYNSLYYRYKKHFGNDSTAELLNNNFSGILAYLKESANKDQLVIIDELIKKF